MWDLIGQYGLFLAKAVTIVVAILIIIASIISTGHKGKHGGGRGTINVNKLNDKYTDVAE